MLVCIDDYIVYRHPDQPPHIVPIPVRENASIHRGSMIVASVLHKMKTSFFLLVQNEDGDLFKVTVEHDEEQVKAVRIKYFDTVPVAASLCILRSGYLFVASDSGSQCLYAFEKLGDDDDEPEYLSTSHDGTIPTFVPRPLGNLMLAHEIEALDLSLIHI